MSQKVIDTNDGSKTIYLEDLDETYHSIHGAVQEAMHVFIENGLKYVASNKKEITIFEMGFGTGLNALLTAIYAYENNVEITYVGLEAYPVEWRVVEELDYLSQVQHSKGAEFLKKIHQVAWEKHQEIHQNFRLLKKKGRLEDQPEIPAIDLVYYDAFGPRAQAELWNQEHFEYLAKNCQTNAVLVTYCAQGQFKRNLKAAGWQVERLPGPPGKREMTRGTLNA